MSFLDWLREVGSGSKAAGKWAGLLMVAVAGTAIPPLEADAHTPKSTKNACQSRSFLSRTIEAVVEASDTNLPDSEKKSDTRRLASSCDEGAPEKIVDDEEPNELLRDECRTLLPVPNRGMVWPAEDEPPPPIVGLNSS